MDTSFQLIQFSTHPVFILLSLAFNFRATFRSPYITWDYLKNLDWKRPKKPKTNQKIGLRYDGIQIHSKGNFFNFSISQFLNFSIFQFFNFSISQFLNFSIFQFPNIAAYLMLLLQVYYLTFSTSTKLCHARLSRFSYTIAKGAIFWWVLSWRTYTVMI